MERAALTMQHCNTLACTHSTEYLIKSSIKQSTVNGCDFPVTGSTTGNKT